MMMCALRRSSLNRAILAEKFLDFLFLGLRLDFGPRFCESGLQDSLARSRRQ